MSVDIELKIRKIIEEQVLTECKLPIEEEEIDLTKYDMNSLKFITLAVLIEKEFGFEFRDEDLDYIKFITLDKITSYVERRISQSR